VGRFYYICEKLRSGKVKLLTVLNGKAAALAALTERLPLFQRAKLGRTNATNHWDRLLHEK
jgi:hypothetical protein